MVPQLITLLVVVAATAAVCGYTASAIAQRKKQRARRPFVTGFLFGFTAGVVVRRNWREVGRLAVRTLSSVSSRPNVQAQRPRRLPLALLPVRR